MSLAAVCGWSFARSVLVAVASLPLCWSLCRLLTGSRGWVRSVTWGMLLVPFLIPDLLVGYAYANSPLDWRIQFPAVNELLFVILVAMKCVPVGTVAMFFAPPSPISAEAIHCRRMAFRRAEHWLSRWMSRAAFWLHGGAVACLPAAAIIFLIAFQEFELASRLEMIAGTTLTPAAWTVKLYDAQVGGLPVTESLRLAALPVLCEIAVLLPVLWIVIANRRSVGMLSTDSHQVSSVWGGCLRCYLAVAAILYLVIPSAQTLSSTIGDAEVFARALKLTREIITSGVFAVLSGSLAYAAAAWILERTVTGNRQGLARLCAALLSLPGLFGSLMLSLTVLYLLQLPGLSLFYANSFPPFISRIVTALPLAITLAVWLFPRALLLQMVLFAVRESESLGTADLLRDATAPQQRHSGRLLYWQLRLRGHFWAMALVYYWAYWELTATSLLAPPGMVSAPARLYNLMHYTQNAVLSAMLCLTILFPVVVLVVAMSVRGPFLRWFVR